MQVSVFRRYLTIPLQMAPLLFVIVFSLLWALALQAGLLGIPLAVLLFQGVVRYSFAVADATCRGSAELPTLTIEMMNPVGEMRSLVVLTIVVAAFFATGAGVYWMGPVLAVLTGLVVLTLLIAIIAVQVATGSLLQAFDPRRWAGLIWRLGADYAVVVACAVALYLSGLWLAHWQALPFVVRLAPLLLAWLAIFALIGGMLYERRQDIGLEDADEPEPQETDHSKADRLAHEHLLDRIYAEWRNGAHSNAWHTICAHLAANADADDELHWLYERVAAWPDPRMAGRLADRLAQEIVGRQLAARGYAEALRVTIRRLQVNADFRPRTSAELVHLAGIARDVGERRVARNLLKDFQRLYPAEALPARIGELQRELER